MNIYLVRHGEKLDVDKNDSLIGLTKKGVKQANLVGARLCKYNVDKIYSSDMIRATETASEINNYLKTEIIIVPELREIHMGACNENGWGYLVKNYPEFIEEFNKHESDIRYPPDGECGADVWNRAIQVINNIIQTDDNNVVIITHGGVIRTLLAGILKIGQEKRFIFGEPLQNCSITMIKYEKSKSTFIVNTFNDSAHLEVEVDEK